MKFLLTFRKPLVATLVIAMIALSVPVLPAHAVIVGTDQIIEQMEGVARDRVVAFLNRQDVRAQLKALGISPREAKARVAALSDEEITKIAGQIDNLPAGQGAAGAIVGAAVVIFIVLLIKDLLGLTHVFGFTKKGSLNPS